VTRRTQGLLFFLSPFDFDEKVGPVLAKRPARTAETTGWLVVSLPWPPPAAATPRAPEASRRPERSIEPRRSHGKRRVPPCQAPRCPKGRARGRQGVTAKSVSRKVRPSRVPSSVFFYQPDTLNRSTPFPINRTGLTGYR
jgi:hypothetical protein